MKMMKQNNKSMNSSNIVNIMVHAIMLLFVANFYIRLIWSIKFDFDYLFTDKVYLFNFLKDAFTMLVMFFPFPLLISYLIYKKTTMVGFFIGFIVQWIIFLNTNPYPLTQDNKLAIMELIPQQYRPEIQFPLDDLKKSSMNKMNVKFPIIVKPTVCSGRRKNVTIVRTPNDLDNFFKENEDTANYMVQNYLSDEEYDIEIGVLWEKMPWEKEGKIIEINDQPKFKKNKDETTKQEEDDKRKKAMERKKIKTYNHLINDDLNELFNHISKRIKGFNVGRYDILIKSLDDFQNGDFKILEVNGIWGGQGTMHDVDNPFGLINWTLRRFVIGLGNIVTLHGYSPLNLAMAMFESYKRMMRCDNPLFVFSLYV
jgi:hypothetical protein